MPAGSVVPQANNGGWHVESVAQARSRTTAVTGIGIDESAVDLANGVKDGSWVEFGMGALGAGQLERPRAKSTTR
ncbi:MAG TPA: hypothetical protein VJT49_15120 [Amycolatopsis sp.]|uniref:hypothetical protein n=1 Tax=Amycolatopsis sp. TaxID=37632 RepID=UPI002B46A9FF|nr:hypothetical protein [Amycolatopsis sp.]HKS46411.1 hypothetical protein [Amycolatopsis sp.]